MLGSGTGLGFMPSRMGCWAVIRDIWDYIGVTWGLYGGIWGSGFRVDMFQPQQGLGV